MSISLSSLDGLKIRCCVGLLVVVLLGCSSKEQPDGDDEAGGASGIGGSPAATGGSAGSAPDAGSDCPEFGFFVTSQARLFALAQEFNGSTEGFGGDLRYGETGPGAGLRGADRICQEIAEQSCANNGETWRAFLSVSDDGSGSQVNAIDRVGNGPWYDRLRRLVALTREDLVAERPVGADPAILDDLPNEDGVPNHAPDGVTEIDNHNVMTGSDISGSLASSTSYSTTCMDWQDATAESSRSSVGPNVGNSWWGGVTESPARHHWIYAGHNAAGCRPGAIDPYTDYGFGVGEGDVNCGTVGCMGGYGGIYCFAERL